MNRHTFAAITLSLLGMAAGTQAQHDASRTPAAAHCAWTDTLTPQQLYGHWELRLWAEDGQEQAPMYLGAVVFERHPEYTDGVRGRLQRQSGTQTFLAQVSGDMNDGEFTLDESADGQRIDAAWVGALAPQSCGREIRGVRHPALETRGERMLFLLHKTPGWR